MRELAFGGRQTGRTTTLLLTMIEEMSMHEDDVYLVVSRFCLGQACKDTIQKLNGEPSRVKVIQLESLHLLNGVDPFNVYIEHTAYEQANSRQLQAIYMVEDAKDAALWSTRL